ncbi:hypothetical protein [Chryseobacterium lathyri]|uniref:Uncharacterized protein n=1 Tax=Chryseobacterium lathyri TaxID=395933 RepID=A0A511YG07_9FLAO|nr:hypothetical protein [Chryseobacterium lathyri]GEN74111.1 hypothetical protein CLA01_41830 [Chryseobacterium lathyri]
MIGETKTLNKDAKFGKSFWAKKGEKVKIITISGNAVTCEKSNGYRFPCNIKDLE